MNNLKYFLKSGKIPLFFVIFRLRKIINKMIKLNKDKIQIRYITGIGKAQLNYPTALDILYESCVENADETLFSHAKMENRYGASDEKISAVINELLNKNYIVQSGNKFKIIGTPWD